MDGQTDDVWEVEANYRRISMELQEDDAEQEQVTALWEDEVLVKVWANMEIMEQETPNRRMRHH